MNKNITLEDFLNNTDFFISEAKAGKVFVYPTDTIYGIGALYTDENAEKVFDIKKRDKKKKFSIIAPDFEWMLNKYATTKTEVELKEYLDIYPGVTYIFDYDHPGVRIIKHPFQDFVKELGEAFITTSCNTHGKNPVQEIKKIPLDIEEAVNYIIDGGILSGNPSVLIDFVSDKIIKR